MARTVSLVKYGKRITMLGVLVRLMEEALDGLALPEVDGVVPVPLTPLRMAARGFNQAGALALPVARRLGVPLLNRAIGRVRGTPQAGLAGSMRERNARASYRKGKRIEEVAGRRILLFDDVYTTGATVRRCSRILKDAGGWVVVLTLARAVGGKDGGHFVVNDPV
ncbi:MAG: ComF family protein [bacterium]|nr:MAG: ComF family protein [bacterium]